MIVPFPCKKKITVQEVLRTDSSNLKIYLPVYASPVQAGFPSLSEDFTEGQMDLNEHLINNPTKTFIVKVSGDSMIDARIHPGDLLIVDQSLEAADGNIVIAAINGELTVKRLCQQDGTLFLMPENSGYPGIEIKEEMNFLIWGVVTNVIHNVL